MLSVRRVGEGRLGALDSGEDFGKITRAAHKIRRAGFQTLYHVDQDVVMAQNQNRQHAAVAFNEFECGQRRGHRPIHQNHIGAFKRQSVRRQSRIGKKGAFIALIFERVRQLQAVAAGVADKENSEFGKRGLAHERGG